MNLKSILEVIVVASVMVSTSIYAGPLSSDHGSELPNGSMGLDRVTPIEHDPHRQVEALSTIPGMGISVLYADGDKVVCGLPKGQDAIALKRRVHNVPLHFINTKNSSNDTNGTRSVQSQSGATILMRATEQLERYAEAKQAFLRAARTWESLIQNPITLVIDVDFGPMRFGEAYPANVLGSTDSQGISWGYQDVRSALIQSATDEEERLLYEALPEGDIVTDIGPTSNVHFPSAVFRALGLIPAEADPQGEGPTIGFNSGFAWDFNPDDGIDPSKQDFVGTALHEIGHALGFTSNVGLHELYPNVTPHLSMWDLYRLIPGAGADFTHATRILSSGNEQVFYSGQAELPLSTGRPDGSGGDWNQASHWKDDDLSGVYLGIMDPTGTLGVRTEITANDLQALDRMGYVIASETPAEPLAPLGTIHDTLPEFSWTAAPEAHWYLVFVLGDQAVVAEGQVSAQEAGCEGGEGTCATRPHKAFAPGQSYRWWVGAMDAQGNFLGASEIATFRIE